MFKFLIFVSCFGNIFGTLPESGMDAVQIAEYFGYPFQTFQVKTKDEVELTVFRIPFGRNDSFRQGERRPAVFIQHGICSSAFDFMANLPEQSAAFYFADLGYDVFISNTRGNSYSLVDDWNFSLDDHVELDLPAMIDLALSVSRQESLYYIGHSQGTSIMFAKLSDDPDFGRKIKKFFALAPVTTISHVRGALKELSRVYLAYDLLAMSFGPLISNNFIVQTLKGLFCTVFHGSCEQAMMFIGGPYSKTLNQTRLEVLIAHSPDGTSLKNVYHWAQMFYAKKFQKFDYGKTQNVEFYGQEFPPKYNLSSIQTDTYLFFSDNDYLATPQDIQTNIFQTMGPKFLKYHENLKDYNHLDFMWSITATERIYSKIHHFIHENKNL